MITANINKLELTEFRTEQDPSQGCRATFPMFGALGTRNSATVYFELDAGEHLGRHTDSEEELLFIVDGEVEVSVADEIGRLQKGEIALVPKMVPHDLKNIGERPARVLGFFGAPHIVATFDNTWQPVGSNVVDTKGMAQRATEPIS